VAKSAAQQAARPAHSAILQISLQSTIIRAPLLPTELRRTTNPTMQVRSLANTDSLEKRHKGFLILKLASVKF